MNADQQQAELAMSEEVSNSISYSTNPFSSLRHLFCYP